MNNLLKLRKKIDECDRELIKIFSKRFSVVKKIALYKKENNLRPLDAGRWREVLGKIMRLSSRKKISRKLVKSVMDSIHEESLRIEKSIISKNSEHVKK